MSKPIATPLSETAAAASPAEKPAVQPLLRSRMWLDILHLFTLSSFAVSQTLYDHIANTPALVTRNVNGPAALLVLVFILSALVPLTLTVVELVASFLGRRAREATHIVLMLFLFLVLILPVLNRFTADWRAVYVLICGILLATIAAMAYSAAPRVRSVLTVASPAILIFPGVFLFHSCVTNFLFPDVLSRTTAKRPVPIVMVVFDEFCGITLENEAHEIDASRYPNFAKLAATSDWYRNATAVHARTSQAIPAILTGNRMRKERAPIVTEYPNNLLDVMARSSSHEPVIFEPYTLMAPEMRAGYFLEHQSALLPAYNLLPTLGIVFLHHLCPVEERVELPPIPRNWFGLNLLEDVNRLQRNGIIRWPWTSHRDEQLDHFLNCIRPRKANAGDDERPQFLFMHYILPHVPLVYLPSGKKYQLDVDFRTVGGVIGYGFAEPNWKQDELAVARAHQRYLLQVGFVDHCLGRLQDRLREQGVFDDCLLIVTADHGTSFRTRLPRREPLDEATGDVMSIPLFIKWPGQKAGKVSDRNVESVDILPTIAEFLGLPVPIPHEGESFLDEKRPERPEKVMLHGAEFHISKAFPQRQSTHNLMVSRFGAGNGWKGVYSLGPHQELVGRPVSSMTLGAPVGVVVQLETKWSRVPDSARGQYPGFLAGFALAPRIDDYPIFLAVAVNGVIQGVTRTYDFRTGAEDKSHDHQNHWELCIPEEAFHAGDNQFDYYVVRKVGSEFTLHPTGS
jgi:hypothetical protein